MTKERRRRVKKWILGALAALPPLLGIYAFGVEPYWIQVTRHETGSGAREVRILHLTDIHCRPEVAVHRIRY